MMKTYHNIPTIIFFLICLSSCGSKSQVDTQAHPENARDNEAANNEIVRNYDSLVTLKNIIPIERKLTTPDPSKEAKAVYKYLLDMYGKKILSGQMWVPWSFDELNYLQ